VVVVVSTGYAGLAALIIWGPTHLKIEASLGFALALVVVLAGTIRRKLIRVARRR
jgi:hypothetical protein